MAKMTMNEIGTELTAEELCEIETAAGLQPVFDDDSPEMTLEMLKQFKRINRTKQTASIRLSPKAQVPNRSALFLRDMAPDGSPPGIKIESAR